MAPLSGINFSYGQVYNFIEYYNLIKYIYIYIFINLFVSVMKLDRKSAGDEGLSFPDYSYPKLKRWDARQDVIALPRSMFDKGKTKTMLLYLMK